MMDADRFQRIVTHDFCKVGNNLYFVAMHSTAFYRYSLINKTLKFLGFVPSDTILKGHQYGPVTEMAGKIYMPPMNGKSIAIYDIKSGIFKNELLQENTNDLPSLFRGVVSYKAKVIFIPCRYHYIVEYDSETNLYLYINLNNILRLNEMFNDMIFLSGYFIKDQFLYLAAYSEMKIIKLNMDTYEFESHVLGDGNTGFGSMILDNNGYIWLQSAQKPETYRWDEISDSIECIKYEKNVKSSIPFYSIVQDENTIYVVSYQEKSSLAINKKTLQITESTFGVREQNEYFEEWGSYHYYAKQIDKNRFFICNTKDRTFDLIKNGKLEEHIIFEDNRYLYAYKLLDKLSETNTLVECESLRLAVFCDVLPALCANRKRR